MAMSLVFLSHRVNASLNSSDTAMASLATSDGDAVGSAVACSKKHACACASISTDSMDRESLDRSMLIPFPSAPVTTSGVLLMCSNTPLLS